MGANFKFRLQKLLEYRRTEVELAMRDFTTAKNQELVAEERLKSMNHDLQRSVQLRSKLQLEGGPVSEEIQAIQEYYAGQRIRIDRERRVLLNLQEVAEQKRLILVEANKQVKTLEKLREKKQFEFNKELNQRELKELDDLIVMRHGRREIV